MSARGQRGGAGLLGRRHEEIRRSQVRDAEREVKLENYAVASSQANLFEEAIRRLSENASPEEAAALTPARIAVEHAARTDEAREDAA